METPLYENPDRYGEMTKEQIKVHAETYDPISWHFGHQIIISRFTDWFTDEITDYQIECLDCENETLAVQIIQERKGEIG